MESSFCSIPNEAKGPKWQLQQDDSWFSVGIGLSKGLSRGSSGGRENDDIYQEVEGFLKMEPLNKKEYYKTLNKIRKSTKAEKKFRYICKICSSIRNISTIDKMKTLKAIDIQFFGLLLRASNIFRYYAMRTINCLFNKKTNNYLKALVPFVNILIYKYLSKLKRVKKRLAHPVNITNCNSTTNSDINCYGNVNKNNTGSGIENDYENVESHMNSRGGNFKAKNYNCKKRYITQRESGTKGSAMHIDNIIDTISQINFDSDTGDDMSDDSDMDGENGEALNANIQQGPQYAEEKDREEHMHKYKYKCTDNEYREMETSRNRNMGNKEYNTQNVSADYKEEERANYCDVYDEAISFFLNLQAVNAGEDIVHSILYDENLNDIDTDADIYFMRKRYELNQEGDDDSIDEEDDEEEEKEEEDEEEIDGNFFFYKPYNDNTTVLTPLEENKSTRELVNCVNELGYGSKGIKQKTKEKKGTEEKKEEVTNKKTDIKSVGEGTEQKKIENMEEEENEGNKENRIYHSEYSSCCDPSSLSSAPTLYDFSGCGKRVSTIKYLFYILYEHIKIKEIFINKAKQAEKQEKKKETEMEKKQQNSSDNEREKHVSNMVMKENKNNIEEQKTQKEINSDKTEEGKKNVFTVIVSEEMQIKNKEVEMDEKEKKNGQEQKQKQGHIPVRVQGQKEANLNVDGKEINKKKGVNMTLEEDIINASNVLMSEKSMNATIVFLNNAIIRLKNTNYIDPYFFLLNRLLETFQSCHPIIVICLETFLKYVHSNNFVYLLSEDNINKFYANVIALFSMTRLISEKQMLYKLYSTIFTCLKYKYVEKKSLSIFTCPIGYMSVELNLFMDKMIHAAERRDPINQMYGIENIRSELAILICQNVEQIIHFLSFHINFHWTQEEVINNISIARHNKIKKTRFRSRQNNDNNNNNNDNNNSNNNYSTNNDSNNNISFFRGEKEEAMACSADPLMHGKEKETGTDKNDADYKKRSVSGNFIYSPKRNMSESRMGLRSRSKSVKGNINYDDPVVRNENIEDLDLFEYEYLSASHVNAILVQLSYMIEYVIEGLIDLAKMFDFCGHATNKKEPCRSNAVSYNKTDIPNNNNDNKNYSNNISNISNNNNNNTNSNISNNRDRLDEFLGKFRLQLNAIIRFFCSYMLYENVFHLNEFMKVIDFFAYCLSESDFYYLLLLDRGINIDMFYKKDIFLSKMFHYVFSTNMQGVEYMSLPLQIFYKYTNDLMESITINERKNVTGNLEMINACKQDYMWIMDAYANVPKLKGFDFVYFISYEEYQHKRDLSFQRNVENVIYYVYDFFVNYYFSYLNKHVNIDCQNQSGERRNVKHDLVRNNYYNKTNIDLKRNKDIYISSMNVILSVCSMLFIRFDSSLLMRFLDRTECLFVFECFFSAFLNIKQTERTFQYFQEEQDLSILRKLCKKFTRIMYMMMYHHPVFVCYFIHRLKTQKLGHVFQNFFRNNKSRRTSERIWEEFIMTFIETHS